MTSAGRFRPDLGHVQPPTSGDAYEAVRGTSPGHLNRFYADLVATELATKTVRNIGAQHRRVREARIIPPPPGDQLRAACERWVQWLTAPRASARFN